MRYILIKKDEKELLDSIASANIHENSIWKIPNLLIPLFAIFLSIISLFAFSKGLNLLKVINLIVNGSLPLIAINQISGIGLNVFKYDKSQEKRLNIESIHLRVKLLYLSLATLVLGVILFSYQVINSPFAKYIQIVISILFSVLLLIWSSYLAKKLFLLQDNFIEKTFETEMRAETQEKHGKNW